MKIFLKTLFIGRLRQDIIIETSYLIPNNTFHEMINDVGPGFGTFRLVRKNKNSYTSGTVNFAKISGTERSEP